jgi:hypothetical protein
VASTRSHLLLAVPLCIAAVVVGMIVPMSARADRPSDEPEGVPGPSTLSAAVAATRAVASARVELATTLPGPAGPVTLVHHAAFTDGGLRAQATTDMSQMAAALAAAGQQLDGDWSQPTGVVVDGDTVYAQLGPMAPQLGRSPTDWTRARLADVAGTRADNDTLALVLDPLGPLDLLRRPVLEVGEVAAAEEVHGVGTRHLRARLDLTAADPTAAERTNGAGPPASFEARLVAAGFETLPVDVWIAADGTVRRLAVTVEAGESLTTTFDVYDLGDAVTIEVPDPADVIVPDDPPDPADGTTTSPP